MDDKDQSLVGDIVDPATGQPRLHSAKCATCIYWPGNRMSLGPGRLKEITEENLRRNSWVSCHERLPYGEYPELGEAVCRGYYDAVGDKSAAVHIVQALGGFTEVPPPPDPRKVKDE